MQSEVQIEKEKFSRNALWGGSIRSSFHRSKVYKKYTKDKPKKEFKNGLRSYVFEMVKQYEKGIIDEETHLRNIRSLKKWTRKYAAIFDEGDMRYGICQKLLNVFLKELWCAGKITHVPPHLPVDRLIQEKLKLKPVVNWTQIDSEEEYMKIIERIKVIANETGLSLAELELLAYNDLVEERT